MGYVKKLFLFLFLPVVMQILFVYTGHSKETKVSELVILNNAFYGIVANLPAIIRDDFFNDNINKIVQTRGMVLSIGKFNRYRKRYRLVASDQDALQMGFSIIYYVYLDDENTVNLIAKDQFFEFSGQLMSCTPVNTRRDSYILDIVLEKGAVLVK